MQKIVGKGTCLRLQATFRSINLLTLSDGSPDAFAISAAVGPDDGSIVG